MSTKFKSLSRISHTQALREHHALSRPAPSAFLTVIATLAVALFILLGAPTANADITRGCTGILSLYISSGEGLDNSRARNMQIDVFDGIGACKNRTQANTCRARAKDNVFRCANDLWNIRWNLIGDPKDSHADLGIPLSCQARGGTGAKNLGPFHKNKFGKYFDIKHAIEYNSCCKMQPGAKKFVVSLTVHSGGDKGCGNDRSPYGGYREHRTLESNYQVNCKQLIKQGMCAKRTN